MKFCKIFFFLAIAILLLACNTNELEKKNIPTGEEDRKYCIKLLQKIVDPVLIPLSEQRFHEVFPHKDWELQNERCDFRTTNIQAVGRTLSGMSPWLSLGVDDTVEGQLRAKYIDLAQKALINVVDPNSSDYLYSKDTDTYERVIHSAYLAYPLLIAPEQLWEPLTSVQKENVLMALKSHRKYKPFNNNWLLFASIIEAAIWKFTGECEVERIEYGVNRFMDWYVGDGMYGDGPQFHWDYYNSFVIHPLLLEILKVCKEKTTI